MKKRSTFTALVAVLAFGLTLPAAAKRDDVGGPPAGAGDRGKPLGVACQQAGIDTLQSLGLLAAVASEGIEVVGLGHKRLSLGKELSTGQRKRLELARALSINPSLLLLDEITGGVDQKSFPGLVDLVGRLRGMGVTLVIIEHNMRVITELADRMTFLNRGEILAEGTPGDILAMDEVRDLYLGDGDA